MSQTNNSLTEIILNHLENVETEKKLSTAIDLIYNIAVSAGSSHCECMGILECVKFEMQNDFNRASENNEKNFTKFLSQN